MEGDEGVGSGGEEAREAQRRLRWHELGYLEGGLLSLYGLVLQCLVTELRLDVGEEEREAALLPIVLRDSSPVR